MRFIIGVRKEKIREYLPSRNWDIFTALEIRLSIGLLILPLVSLWGGISPAAADTIAVLYALDADLAQLKKASTEVKSPVKIGAQTVATLKIGRHTLHAAKMGSGCITTAIATESVLGRFDCDLVISIGPAGALRDDHPVGSWVRVAEVVPYQAGSWTTAGFVPKATMRLPEPNHLPKEWKGRRSAKVASGEAFVASDREREKLAQTLEAGIVDMNTAGLVLAGASHKLPVWAWRVISDNADNDASADFREFIQKYDGEGGRQLAELFERLPDNPANPMAYDVLRELIEPGERE